MNYWLVFKIKNGRRIYVSETDEFDNEGELIKFSNITVYEREEL